MIEKLHIALFSIFPVLVSTPKKLLPRKPTQKEVLELQLEEAKNRRFQILLERTRLRGEERKEDVVINELELLLVNFDKEEEDKE